MGKGQGPLHRFTKMGAFVAVLVLALSVPGIAFARNTATFRSAAPVGATTVADPLIGVTVYDKYGVTAMPSMKLDGTYVARTMTRIGSGLNRFRLSYQVPADLAVGSHAVTVRVKDRRGRISKTTWHFTVAAASGDTTDPVTTFEIGAAGVTLEATDEGGSGVAHTYYKLDNGIQTEGTVVGSSVVGLHTVVFWSVDVAGNVESQKMTWFVVTVPIAESHELPELECADSGCHGTKLVDDVLMPIGLPDIHKGACFMCHVDDNPSMTTNNCMACHGVHEDHDAIASTDPTCANCHVVGALAAMTGHDTCATCHSSTIPAVVAAIAAEGATCQTCHGDPVVPSHEPAIHTIATTNSCTAATFCHEAGNVADIHDGVCARCHADGVTPSVVCADCHDEQHLEVEEHTTINTCASGDSAACHASNAMLIHAATGGPGCAACHANAAHDASTDCAVCHATPPASHTTEPAHTVAGGGCFNATCHSNDVSLIHGGGLETPRPGCADCHNSEVTASVTCSACHPAIPGPDDPHNVVYDAATQTAHHVNPAACSSCHVQATGIRACADCHDGTPPIHASIASTESSACIACHGTDLAVAHAETATCFCHVQAPSWLEDEVAALAAAPGATECIDCHNGTHAAHAFAGLASGHSTSTYGFRGMWDEFDGSDGGPVVLDTRGDPIEGEWAIPTARVFWTPGAPNTPEGAYVGTDPAGLNDQSEITCRDCHAGLPLETGDPHGAVEIANAGIDPDYPVPYKNAVLSHYNSNVVTDAVGATYTLAPAKSGINYRTSWETTKVMDLRIGDEEVICAKCHDLFEENAAGTASADASSAAFFGFGNFVHEEHSRHNALGRGDCVNCHAAIPHGWNRPRLLIQTYTGTATQTVNGVETAVEVVADEFPYSAPRGYYVAGQAQGGFASFFPGMTDKRMGLALLPAVWGSNPDTARDYVAGGPGDHPAIEIPRIGSMESTFTAPEWQERSSDCQAGCGGSLGRHPKTVQGSFLK